MVSWTVDVVGAQTLEKFQQLWIKKGTPLPKPKKEVNVFKFGTGHREVSETSLAMPVGIGGRRGTICAAVVQGDAPLLISRPALKTLQANLSFGGDSLTLISDKLEVPVTLLDNTPWMSWTFRRRSSRSYSLMFRRQVLRCQLPKRTILKARVLT